MPGFMDQIYFEEEAERQRESHRRFNADRDPSREPSGQEAAAHDTTALDALASAATASDISNRAEGIGQRTSTTHSRQSSVSTPSEGIHRHSSMMPVAGADSAAPRLERGTSGWTTGQKRRYAEFATSLCERYRVPDDKRQALVERSQLSTHDLLITIMVSNEAGTPSENSFAAGRAFIGSDAYKDGVISKLYAILLYAELSAYKEGLLERCLHHIRLHPSEYEIPDSAKPFIFTRDFAKSISVSLSACRSELKRKMAATWATKSTIYTVVKKLVGNLKSQITVSEATWHRWAWVHLKYSDFQKLVQRGEKKNVVFWSWLDEELEDLRRKFHRLPDAERSKRINRIFELSLEAHLRACPAKQTPKCNPRISVWQAAIYTSIQEMQSYTNDVLGVEEGCEDEEAEDEVQAREGSADEPEASGDDGDGNS